MTPEQEAILARCAKANYIGQHERLIGAAEAEKEWDELPGGKRMDYRKGAERVLAEAAK